MEATANRAPKVISAMEKIRPCSTARLVLGEHTNPLQEWHHAFPVPLERPTILQDRVSVPTARREPLRSYLLADVAQSALADLRLKTCQPRAVPVCVRECSPAPKWKPTLRSCEDAAVNDARNSARPIVSPVGKF